MISLAGLALVLGALIAVSIIRSVLAQLGGEPTYVAEVVKRVSVGDLTFEVQTKAKDKSSMLFVVKDMVNTLTDIVTEVRNSSDSISIAAKQIAAGNSDLSQRTEEQASSLEETASSMEELTSTVKQNAALVEEAAAAAEAMQEQAEELIRAVSIFNLAADHGSARTIVARPETKPVLEHSASRTLAPPKKGT